jgi:hypothetical protein
MRGSLCGYVVRDDTERPLDRAVVQALAGAAREPRTTLTDKAGWFVLDGLPPGNWLLHAQGPDSETGEASAPVFANAFSDVTIRVGASCGDGQVVGVNSESKGRVKQMQHGSVNGNVVRAGTGEPVQDASVSVVKGAGPAPDIAPLTNAEGRFILDGLPPGDWTFRARGPDGEMGEAAVRVLAGKAVDMTIVVRV